MSSAELKAGIVTYEPEIERLCENLVALRDQVSEVFIYDNHSSNILEISRIVESLDNVVLLAGDENLGIAAALNIIATVAENSGAEWLLTLDQDSVCPPHMVRELTRHCADDVGMVTPYIVDRNKESLKELGLERLPETSYYSQAARRGAITSGAIVRLAAWRSVSGWDEIYFIDYVDYDFNQRLLNEGYTIIRCNRTHLLHEVGSAKPTWLRVPRKDILGKWRIERFYSFGHSPFRCYYKARNRVIFTRKYGRKLGITHEGMWQIPQQIALTLLFERNRAAKFRAFARGIWDGFRVRL